VEPEPVVNQLLSTLIGRPLVMMSGLVFCLVAGIISYINIPKEQEPDLDPPLIVVDVTLEGVSPPDAERLLARPMEEQLAEIEGLKQMTSTAYQGGARVSLEFFVGFDPDVATQEIRTKIDMARPEMPSEIDEPRIFAAGAAWRPLMAIALAGDLPQRVLNTYARQLRDAVTDVPGVLDVDLTGLQEEIIEVVIDPTRAQSYRLNNEDLNRLFARANRLVPAGKLDTGQGSFSVSVPGLFETVNDVLDLPVKTNGNAIVRVRDVAEVRRTFKDPASLVRVNGEPAVALEIQKRSGANLIESAEQVYKIIEREQATWPAALKLQITMDGTANMKGQFFTLQNSVILAAFLVMVVVVGSLGFRSGLLVGVSIPGSFLTAVFALYATGVTLSVPVMFGLIISVGLLVDAAIVVVEYADRKMAEGVAPIDAYTQAAQRMSWPTISSTATTVAAFSPLFFWPGLPGQLISYIPYTLNWVLCVSLVMALVFVPTFGSLVGRPDKGKAQTNAFSGAGPIDMKSLSPGTALYVRYLQAALRRPGKVVLATLAVLVSTVILYGFAGNGVMFFPKTEPIRFIAKVHAPGNLSVVEKDKILAGVEAQMDGVEGIKNVYTRTRVAGDPDGDDVVGRINLNLEDWEDRSKGAVIKDELIARTRNIPGVFVEVQDDSTNPFNAKPVSIEFSAIDLEALSGAVAHTLKGMAAVGGFTNIEDTRPLPSIEWRLDVDRLNAARFGTDLVSVGNAVRMITNGLKLGSYRPDDADDEIDILVRYPVDLRSMSQLDEMRIQTSRGMIPLSNFVERIPVQPANEITRVDQRRVMSIDADVADGLLPNAQVILLRQWIADNPLDPGVRVQFRGEQEEQEQSSAFLSLAFLISLFLMAMILLVQFNNFYSVFLILSSVVLSTTGVLLGYLVTGEPFVLLMSGLGIIALAGIVVNNNIVLIDTYERLIKTANSPIDAIIQTGARRLRPVILTTATTCLGLLPMAFTFTIDFFNRSTSLGAPATLWWRELAVTVIFGLLFATVLTLVVTPCALALKARAKDSKVKWAQRWRSVLRPRTTFSIDRRKPQPPAPRSPAE